MHWLALVLVLASVVTNPDGLTVLSPVISAHI
jgi:hypothetical protein